MSLSQESARANLKITGTEEIGLSEYRQAPAELEIYIPPEYSEKPPSLPWKKIIRDREDLFVSLRDEFGSCDRLVVDVCETMSAWLARRLGIKKNGLDVIFNSIYPIFQGSSIDDKLIYRIATRISGNREALSRGQVIPKWFDFKLKEWVFVEVVNIDYMLGFYFAKVLVGTGTPAGQILGQRMSVKFARHVLRQIGYPAFKPFHASEIFGTCFCASIDIDRQRYGMTAYGASSSHRLFNSMLYKTRHGGCPREYVIECQDCLCGIGSCVASVHKDEYEVGECERGHRSILTKGMTVCNSCIYEDRKLKLERKNYARK